MGGCNVSFVTLANDNLCCSTGNNDTDNIQCALDAAIDGEYSTIKLTEGPSMSGHSLRKVSRESKQDQSLYRDRCAG